MLGKQVLDQHKGHTRCRWQAVEQTAEGLETAGGSADANTRKWLGRRLGLLARRRAQRLALTLPLCSRLPALELALHRILTLHRQPSVKAVPDPPRTARPSSAHELSWTNARHPFQFCATYSRKASKIRAGQ